MRVEIQRVPLYLFKEKRTQANEEIDLRGVYDEYWSSNKDEFIVPSQS
jgi:hypothetical protein